MKGFIEVTVLQSRLRAIVRIDDIVAVFQIEQMTKDGILCFSNIMIKNAQVLSVIENYETVNKKMEEAKFNA